MQTIIVRHLSGSKAGQVEFFTLGDFDELTLGRDPSSVVQYDSLKDVLVGRQHAKITRDAYDATKFCITDLNSRNGTFVNHQEIYGTVRIKQGDIVQFGPGGPEFQFEVESQAGPQTLEAQRITLDSIEPNPTLVHSPSPPVASQAPDISPIMASDIASASPSTPVGRRTIEMVLAKSQKETRRYLLIGGGVLLALIAILAGLFFYQNSQSKLQAANGAGRDAAAKGSAKDAAAAADVVPAAEVAEAEADPDRAAWRIPVKPYQVLGSGHPGKGASDFDKPDGVAFTPDGLLLATDAKNRRVQIWNVKTGARLGEFGHQVLGGEIVDIAVAPDGTVLVTDQTLNLAYAFVPPKPGEADDKGKALGPYDYQFKGTRFGEQGFDKLGGIALDSRGRIFVVDAHLNEVRRFNPDYTPDKSWKFEQKMAGGNTYLHGCEGIAIDESAGNLYIASEKDAVIQVFDWETGAYKHQLLGASRDASGAPSGKRVFAGSVEGLTIAQNHLLAVDESAGHIQIFDLTRPDVANTDLVSYMPSLQGRSGGYKGFFGHMPLVNFEDKNDIPLQIKVKEGTIIPGQANPPGYFCSPDSITSFSDSGETYIAIADQCNYRLVVYRWTDIRQFFTSTEAVASNANTSAPASSGGKGDILGTGTPTATPTRKVVAKKAAPPPRKRRVVKPVYKKREAVDPDEEKSKKDSSKKSKKQKS